MFNGAVPIVAASEVSDFINSRKPKAVFDLCAR